MAWTNLTCPHCNVERMRFYVMAISPLPKSTGDGKPLFGTSAVCQSDDCNNHISFEFFCTSPDLLNVLDGKRHCDGDLTKDIVIVEQWPPEPRPAAPAFLPPRVERSFLEGESSRIRGNLTAAGMVFRKALENATRQKATEAGITENNLKRRIEKLVAAQKLTPDIAEWADHIRVIGNEAAHDEDEPTAADINALAALTRMTLIYLYEMPERVRRMREEAQWQGAEA